MYKMKIIAYNFFLEPIESGSKQKHASLLCDIEIILLVCVFYFQQIYAPSNMPVAAQGHLDSTFTQHWTGMGDPIAWTAKTPPLIPQVFFCGPMPGIVSSVNA